MLLSKLPNLFLKTKSSSFFHLVLVLFVFVGVFVCGVCVCVVFWVSCISFFFGVGRGLNLPAWRWGRF